MKIRRTVLITLNGIYGDRRQLCECERKHETFLVTVTRVSDKMATIVKAAHIMPRANTSHLPFRFSPKEWLIYRGILVQSL